MRLNLGEFPELKTLMSSKTFLIVLLLFSNVIQCQEITFKLKSKDFFLDQFYLEVYKDGSSKILPSVDSMLTISRNSIKNSDSTKIYYSYYEERFEFDRLFDNVYNTKDQIGLNQIILNSENKKVYKYQPKGRKGKIFNATLQATMFETSLLDGRFLKKIAIHSSKLRWDKKLDHRGSKLNDDFAEILIHIALTNAADSVELSSTDYKSFKTRVSRKGYTEVDLKYYDKDFSEYDYLVVAIEPLTPNLVLSQKFSAKGHNGLYTLNAYRNYDSNSMLFRRRIDRSTNEFNQQSSVDIKLYYTK